MIDPRALDALYPPEATAVTGLLLGVVTNNADPQHLGRIKLKIPALSSTDETTWAPVASPLAGGGRGWHSLPLVGDLVLVGFEQGDVDFPFVLGSFWTSTHRPPVASDDAAKHVLLRTESGHVVHLDDTEGKGLIEIVAAGEGSRITFDAAGNTVTVEGKAKVVVSSDGDLELTAKGTVKIRGADISIESTASTEVKGATTTVEGSGSLALKGATIGLNQ